MRGITVTLYEKRQIGTDPTDAPIYEETPVEVPNVLVAPSSAEDIIDNLQLYGKKATFTLGIPKGDAHDWRDARVRFFDQDFMTFGLPQEGIDYLIPLDWNKKVMCERYE